MQRLLLFLGWFSQMHWVDLASSEYIMAQFDQVFNVSLHVLAPIRVYVGHEAELLQQVARQHVPEPPELVRYDLGRGNVVGRANSLQLVLELFNLFQKLIDVAGGLLPSLGAAPFVAVRHVTNDVLDGLADLGELLF